MITTGNDLDLSGISTALITPFGGDDALDEAALRQLVDRQAAAGITSIAVAAGCGEYTALSQEEKVRTVEVAVEQARGRIKVLAGVLAPSSGQAAADARAFSGLGRLRPDGLLVLTPFYVSPSAAGLARHFELVASQTDLPIVIYNNPGRTTINLDQDVLNELIQIPTVVAVKECDRDLGRVAAKIAKFGERLTFLGGDDDLALPIWSIGASGSMTSSGNLVPRWLRAIHAEYQNGDARRALKEFQRLLNLLRLYRGPNHPGPLKEVLAMFGFPAGFARDPAARLSESAKESIKEQLTTYSLLET